jgi:hypothetical protein
VLQLSELFDVNEFWTSKLCCWCHCETAKVKFDERVVNSFLHCMNNECGIHIDRNINVAKNKYKLPTKMIQDKNKTNKDYFKCVLRRRSYPPGTSHYLVLKGLGFLNVIYLYTKKTNINSITEITMTQSICQP